MADTAEKERSGGGRWLLLLLLLLLIGGGAYYWWTLRTTPTPSTAAVDLGFSGCDSLNRCADFQLYAPGDDYRWTIGKSVMDKIAGEQPDIGPAIADIMTRATGAIASGLASREGSSAINRQLSACRSMRLSDMLIEAADLTGTVARDNIHRISLGRYGDSDQVGEDTSIERLVVAAFIMRQDDGVDLSQALKDGLTNELPPKLNVLAPEIARQLDFTSYDCWTSEFAVTQSDEIRGSCYAEPSRSYLDFCAGFE